MPLRSFLFFSELRLAYWLQNKGLGGRSKRFDIAMKKIRYRALSRCRYHMFGVNPTVTFHLVSLSEPTWVKIDTIRRRKIGCPLKNLTYGRNE